MSVETAIQKTAVNIRVLTESAGRLSLGATIPDKFLCAGMAVFLIEEDGSLVCDLLHVDKDCRRQGIASAMFDYAENHFQLSVVAGLKMTPDSVDFYNARGIEIPVNAEVKTFHELFDAS